MRFQSLSEDCTPCVDMVKALLSTQDNGQPRRILDVGCGTGTWALEMAHQFPEALVLGIDVAPIPLDTSGFPPNISFELDDINHGLRAHYDQFDVVHMRCVVAGITDLERTLKDLELCLKPHCGGILIVIDGDMPVEENRQSYIKMAKLEGDDDVSGVSENGCWFRRMVWEASEACKMAGSDLANAPETLDRGPRDFELCDPDATMIGSVYLPIGPWPEGTDLAETQILRHVGTLVRQNFPNIHRAWHPILRQYHMNQETLDEWSRQVETELEEMRHRMWVRFRFFWTRRRQGEGLPAASLPVQDGDATGISGDIEHGAATSHEIFRYPAIELYRDQEEAMAKSKERQASRGVLPDSHLLKVWHEASQSNSS